MSVCHGEYELIRASYLWVVRFSLYAYTGSQNQVYEMAFLGNVRDVMWRSHQTHYRQKTKLETPVLHHVIIFGSSPHSLVAPDALDQGGQTHFDSWAAYNRI